jgi:hypothetical protein
MLTGIDSMLVLGLGALARQKNDMWQNLHFIPLAIDSFSILLEIPAVNDFKMGFGISIGLSCRGDKGRRGIDTIDFSDGRHKIGSKFSIATANIEDAIIWLRVEVL